MCPLPNCVSGLIWLDGGMNMIRELDTVVLTRGMRKHGLKRGDVGAVVHCYSDGAAYEVEFVTAEGKTVAALTLTAADIRPMATREILHVREIIQTPLRMGLSPQI
jgi:hypothetical protein